MFQNIVVVFFVLVLLTELYFCAAGANHRRRKKLKGWNQVKGHITSIEDKYDEFSRRKVRELTIASETGNTVYSKQSSMFCVYEEGEEVELIEKDGVHRFIGNERVHAKGVRETLIGTIPLIVLVIISGVLSYLAHIWG